MIQIATTKEQTEELKKLGLPKKYFDMYYPWHRCAYPYGVDGGGFVSCYPVAREIGDPLTGKFKKLADDEEPCCSLSALLEALPRKDDEEGAKGWGLFSIKENDFYGCTIPDQSFHGQTPFETVFNMVKWCLENKRIKKHD